MQRFLFSLGFVFILIACNNSAKQNTTGDSTRPGNSDPSTDNSMGASAKDISGCYLRVLERDTLAAHLQQRGAAVSGKLSFDNFQKDGSTGTVVGKIVGDTLKLVYSFQSEGTNSVMEVYLKIVDDGLVSGTGEVAVKGDTAYYTKTADITFAAENKLSRLPCEQLPQKYK